jgi:hypothetical protein
MSRQPIASEPRILLTAVQELDRLARQFRRRLRDRALELSREAGQSGPVGPEMVLRAVPLACRELSATTAPPCEERGLDGPRQDAA